VVSFSFNESCPCLEHALTRNKNKNKEARAVFDRGRKVIESDNKSGDLKAAFEEKQEESLLGNVLKLRNPPAHR
jgi:hypothetical protein